MCPAERTTTTRFRSLPAEQPPHDTVGPLPRAWNGIDAPTDGSHLLRAPLMMAADQRGSTVMANMVAVFDSDTTEEPEPLESTDRVVDRIRTNLAKASTPIRQLNSDS